jgi:transcriptional regulator with XRE-family HTH domain
MSVKIEREPPNPFRVYSASTLGTAIRHYRSASHLTQAELAARVGIPRNYLNAMESGLETEHLKRVLDVLRELGVRMTLDKADW